MSDETTFTEHDDDAATFAEPAKRTRAVVRREIRPSKLADDGLTETDGDAISSSVMPGAAAFDGEPIEAADGDVDSAGRETLAVDAESIEALLLSTHHPLTAQRLGELLDITSVKPIRSAIKALNEQYEATGRSFRVEQVAGGYQILTLPKHGDILQKLHQKEVDAKLGKAALETLAIIAYKQPILRATVEAIRGVACGETIRSLMEKHLVKISGRAEEPGRPILYGTTKRFLEIFGLNHLKDLPGTELTIPATTDVSTSSA